MTSQPGKQTIAKHTLPNISRIKGNQTMKFGQLVECNMRNIFLEKSYTKCSGETVPGPFSKKSKWAYLWINCLKFYTVCFYCMPSWGLGKGIEAKFQVTCFYIWSFKKKQQKEVWNYSPCLIFCMFLKENVSLVIFL